MALQNDLHSRLKNSTVQIEGSDYAIRTTTENSGTSLVNGKPQGTVFGADMTIAQEKPEVSGKFNLGIDVNNSYTVFVGSGNVNVPTNESVISINTGTDANGTAIIATNNRVRYEPGTPIFGKFTAGFPLESESNGDYILTVGFSENVAVDQVRCGIYQRRVSGVIDTGFFINRGDGGASEYFPANGEVPSNMNNLVIYRIEWGYLGVAPFNIYWRNVENEKWVRFHRQEFASLNTSVLRPDLSVGAAVLNQGNTTNLSVRIGSFQAGTINGGKQFDPSARPASYLTEITGGSGADQLIFAFRNPENVDMYDSVDATLVPTTRSFVNVVASQLLEVGLTVNGNNKIVNVEAVIIDSDNLTGGTWTPVSLGYSVLEVSEDVVPVLTDGMTVEVFTLGINDSINKVVETLDLLLPGKTGIFVYSTTANSFDLSGFIKYQDLF